MSVYKVCIHNGGLIMADNEKHTLAPGDVIISDNDIYKGKLMVVQDKDGYCSGCPFSDSSAILSCGLGCDRPGGYVKLTPVDDVLEEL